MNQDHPEVFGIDLGTTYSAIAYVDEHGEAIVIPNDEDETVTPSAIYFETPTNVLVGKVAKMTGRIDPINFVELVKTRMGESEPIREIHGKWYRAEELSALILGKLKRDAEAKLGREVRDVVITVPAYFNESQRNATRQAGELAGLNVKQVIPEPTAAAVAYSVTEEAKRSILVYDLGGGTFDVTVIKLENSKIDVVCVKGDHDLGGRKWDDQIAAYLSLQWQGEHGHGEDPLSDLETTQELINSAEETKKQLSLREQIPLRVTHAGRSTRVQLTRAKFDDLTREQLETTLALTQNAVAEAATLGVSHIDLILFVGGSSRMPQVQDCIATAFPGVERKVFDPELAVAKGAAIYASSIRIQEVLAEVIQERWGKEASFQELPAKAQVEALEKAGVKLDGLSPDAIKAAVEVEVINVCVKNYGLVTLNGPAGQRKEVVDYLIERNRKVPAREPRTYGTVEDGQTEVVLRIIECEVEATDGRALPTDPTDPDCRELKRFVLPLPPGLPSGHPIHVVFELSKDGGQLQVQATDPASGKRVEERVETVGAIAPQEMAKLKQGIQSIVYK